MYRFVSLLLLLVGSLASYAEPSLQTNRDVLIFQVIQDQFILDHTNIDKASLMINDKGIYTGLHIELKKAYVEGFTAMTKAGVGKSANLVLNGNIVSTATIHSPLGLSFVITGLSQGEAQQFINQLRIEERNRVRF